MSKPKGARPLPQVPPPSPSVSSLYSTSPFSAYSFPRPLPIPPLQISNLSVGGSTSPCASPIRPLPVPRSPEQPRSLPSPTGATTISLLRVNIPGSPLTEIFMESPLGAYSPIVFNAAESPAATDTAFDSALQDEKVAKRLSSLGFVEVQPQPQPQPQPQSQPQLRQQQSPEPPTPPPRRDSLLADTRSAVDASSAATDDAPPSSPPRCHDVQITVELVPTKNNPVRRASRFWIREKKGKRWVEEDYGEILQELRRL